MFLLSQLSSASASSAYPTLGEAKAQLEKGKAAQRPTDAEPPAKIAKLALTESNLRHLVEAVHLSLSPQACNNAESYHAASARELGRALATKVDEATGLLMSRYVHPPQSAPALTPAYKADMLKYLSAENSLAGKAVQLDKQGRHEVPVICGDRGLDLNPHPVDPVPYEGSCSPLQQLPLYETGIPCNMKTHSCTVHGDPLQMKWGRRALRDIQNNPQFRNLMRFSKCRTSKFEQWDLRATEPPVLSERMKKHYGTFMSESTKAWEPFEMYKQNQHQPPYLPSVMGSCVAMTKQILDGVHRKLFTMDGKNGPDGSQPDMPFRVLIVVILNEIDAVYDKELSEFYASNNPQRFSLDPLTYLFLLMGFDQPENIQACYAHLAAVEPLARHFLSGSLKVEDMKVAAGGTTSAWLFDYLATVVSERNRGQAAAPKEARIGNYVFRQLGKLIGADLGSNNTEINMGNVGNKIEALAYPALDAGHWPFFILHSVVQVFWAP